MTSALCRSLLGISSHCTDLESLKATRAVSDCPGALKCSGISGITSLMLLPEALLRPPQCGEAVWSNVGRGTDVIRGGAIVLPALPVHYQAAPRGPCYYSPLIEDEWKGEKEESWGSSGWRKFPELGCCPAGVVGFELGVLDFLELAANSIQSQASPGHTFAIGMGSSPTWSRCQIGILKEPLPEECKSSYLTLES